MDYLGQSLKEVKDSIGQKLHLGVILKIGLQIIDRLEAMHSLGYAH